MRSWCGEGSGADVHVACLIVKSNWCVAISEFIRVICDKCLLYGDG